MLNVGLLSDTHGYLDTRVFTYFAECDEIWHAGDIGTLDVAERLSAFKPLRAVHGNVDGAEIRQRYPEDLEFQAGGLRVLMTHIAGTPPRYNPRVRKLLESNVGDILVCGHSHILQISKDASRNNMVFINPGAAGNHGFHRVKTLVRFAIDAGQIKNLEVIEIGLRGALS